MSSLTIQSIERQTELLYHVQMQETLDAFTEPGQYAIVQADGKKAYFAFSSMPGEPVSFLLKNEGHPASLLCKAKPGDRFDLLSVEGTGFDRTGAGDDILLFSMGSGLGPFRSLLRFVYAERWQPGSLQLWHGAFTEADLPYKEEILEWQNRGLRFVGCYDREGQKLNAVQRLKQASPDLSKATLFWIGSREFGEALQEVALSLGLKPERFRSNYG